MTREEAIQGWVIPAIKNTWNEKKCKEILEALEQEPRWIPISEKLPEKSGNYWCAFGGTNLTGSDYYTNETDAKEIAKEIFDEPEKYVGWDSQKVVAWMPLPNPYVPDINIGKMEDGNDN